jgi:hypothetical protein
MGTNGGVLGVGTLEGKYLSVHRCSTANANRNLTHSCKLHRFSSKLSDKLTGSKRGIAPNNDSEFP